MAFECQPGVAWDMRATEHKEMVDQMVSLQA